MQLTPFASCIFLYPKEQLPSTTGTLPPVGGLFSFFAGPHDSIDFISVYVCMRVKTSVPSGDGLIDVYTGNTFNNLMPTSKEITPKSTLLFIYSLQIFIGAPFFCLEL